MGPKERAAEAAVQHVKSGMVVGLGTGSTADYFLIALARRLREGALKDVRGVPTSRQSEKRSLELGIPLVGFNHFPAPDLTVDGADEVDSGLQLIKGLGGALVREKIVAQASRGLIIIADESKRVPRLGAKAPLPVEVVQFAHENQADFLKSLGAAPVLRPGPAGAAFITDNGNFIYDCRFAGGIADPPAIDRALAGRAGIVDSGLFLGLATLAIIAGESSVETLRRP